MAYPLLCFSIVAYRQQKFKIPTPLLAMGVVGPSVPFVTQAIQEPGELIILY
jgi:hypothetical protein